MQTYKDMYVSVIVSAFLYETLKNEFDIKK